MPQWYELPGTLKGADGADGTNADIPVSVVDVPARAANVPFVWNHGRGTVDIGVWVREVATGKLVDADLVVTSTQVTFTAAMEVTAGAYRLIAIGGA